MGQMDSNKHSIERSLEVNMQSVQRSLLSILRYHAQATSVLHVAPNNLIDLSAEALLSRQKCRSTHLRILLETKKSPKFAAEFPRPLPAITGRK